MRLLAILATKAGKHDIAEQLLVKAIKLAPTYNLLWRNISLVYRLSGQLDKAQRSMDNILALDPENANVWADYGTVLIMLARYKEAIVAYSRCVSIQPNSPRAYLSLGHVYNTIGNKEKSVESYINSIKYNPNSGEAYWSLANLKTYEFTSGQIQDMESTLKTDISEIEKVQLLFALGKAYESLNDYKTSFKKYSEGNWLKRKSVNYSSQKNTEKTNRIIDFYNDKSLKKIKKSKCSNKDPIFILGLPRSGSTLIDQIISSHSMVDGTQELPNIMNLTREIEALGKSKEAYPKFLEKLSEIQITELGNKYIEQTKWSRGNAPYFIDKMPNNFIHIGFIKTILPNAKIIDTRRGAMDTCFSCFKQFFAKGQLFTYDLEDIGLFYKDYLNLMNHWHDIYPNEIYTVKYSNMINNTEEEINKLLDYCELPFESQCLEFYKSKRPVKTPSAEQVRQPIYKSGLDYWKNFETDLDSLQKLFSTEILND
jgi:tetratricopeptide (TPR) repeat protein